MAISLTSGLATAVSSAVANALSGSKRNAGLTALSNSLGTTWKLRAFRSGTEVLRIAGNGALPVTGTTISINSSNFGVTELVSVADIDSGTWVVRIGSTTEYLEGTAGRTGTDFLLSNDLAADSTVSVSSVTFTLPAALDPADVTLPVGRTETTIIRTTSIAVSPDLVGLHAYTLPIDYRGYHAWGNAPEPTFTYNYRRSLNYDGSFWYDIHKGTNQANWQWGGLDTIVNYSYARNQKFLFTFMYTPEHLTWPGLESYPSPAPNWLGSTSMPNDLNQVSVFVTALINRYNTGGVRKLHAIEVWNEPAIDGENYLVSLNVKPYWIGSTADNSASGKAQRLNDLALLHKTIYLAAKAADPDILIIGPGWSPGGSAEIPSQWVNYYTRTISTGGTPLQYTDIFACHPYTGGNQPNGGSESAHIYSILNNYNSCRNAVDATKPLWGTEAGNEQFSATLAQHATVIRRKLMLAAALNYQSMHMYAYEDSNYMGAPAFNSTTAQAFTDINNNVRGKTMTRCSILDDGTLWTTYSNGTSYRE